MASFCRSALMAGSRSIAARSRTLSQSSLNATNPKVMSSPFASSTKAIPSAKRFVSVLGSVDLIRPLHSAIDSPRLISMNAFESICWSSLSQQLDTS